MYSNTSSLENGISSNLESIYLKGSEERSLRSSEQQNATGEFTTRIQFILLLPQIWRCRCYSKCFLKQHIFCLDIWVLTLPRCSCTGIMSVFWTSDSFSSTYFLLSFPHSPLFCLSPKCFSETLFRKQKIVSWLIRTVVEFIAISLAVEWGIMGKMRCISVTEIFKQQMKRFHHSVWILSVWTFVYCYNPISLKFPLQKWTRNFRATREPSGPRHWMPRPSFTGKQNIWHRRKYFLSLAHAHVIEPLAEMCCGLVGKKDTR